MAKRITGTTPRQDGYRMPGEFEEQSGVWMLWPQRPDNWRGGAKPAQQAFIDVARAIARFEPVTVCVNPDQFQNARARLPEDVRVVEMTSNDAWVRDCGPTFVKNDQGGLRAVDWTFNAWGGLYDGLYFPWDQDDLVARKICELEGVDSYRTDDFVLEGGSIHVDGQGTVLTTEMCLLSPGRNPELSRRDIEEKLCGYLGCEKVIWLRDGIDPDETNGHIDDVACFVAPGEVACIWTEDPENPFYQAAQDAFRTLSQATDAKGRRLTVHKLCLTKKPCYLEGAETIDAVEGTAPRENGEVSIASYMNFLIVNGAVIAPQYGDENDRLAIQQLQQMELGVHQPQAHHIGGGGDGGVATFNACHGGLRDAQLLRPLCLGFSARLARCDDALCDLFDLRKDKRRKVCRAGVLARHGANGRAIRAAFLQIYGYFQSSHSIGSRPSSHSVHLWYHVVCGSTL